MRRHFLSLCALSSLFAAMPVAIAASNMSADYEVKFLLKPELVLDSENKLQVVVRDAFQMPSTVTKMAILFIDTDSKAIYNNGWIARLRKTEGESDFELSYKKRYAIDNGNLDQTLTLANSEGFSSKDTNYEAQVEWGYQKQTLSITNSKSDSKSGYSGMDLPSKKDAISLLKKNIPGKMDNWLYSAWGSKQLENGRIYGPVSAKRSIGSFNGNKLYIEVWPIKSSSGNGTEYLVEASFKAATQTQAASLRTQLFNYLNNRGWLLAQDSLKTQLIMDRY